MPHKLRLAETTKKGSNLAPSSSGKDDTPRSASRIINSHSVQSSFRASGRTTSEDTGERPKKRKRTADELDLSPLAHLELNGKGKARDGQGNKKGKTVEDQVEKGRTNQEKGASRPEPQSDIPSILPNERLGEYNRRVEQLLRPGITKAFRQAASTQRLTEPSTKKAKSSKVADARTGEEDEEQLKPNRPLKVFKVAEGPRRLNDIVQAPPSLPFMRRSGSKREEAGKVWGATGRTPLSGAQKRILEEERERVIRRYREIKEAKGKERERK